MIRYSYEGKALRDRSNSNDYGSEFLINLYYSMLRIRQIEIEIENQYSQDQMKSPIHLVIGQESNSVGACAALIANDQIWLSHRTHGHYLAKGGSLAKMLAELYCKKDWMLWLQRRFHAFD